MMLGELSHVAPPWPYTVEDPISPISLSPAITANSFANSGFDDYYDGLKALQVYLPSNNNDVLFTEPESGGGGGGDFPVDAHSCDQFRMFEFKVKKCARGKAHDWTDCPFAHPADSCEFAHGVFECWLHPARYRTQPCKDGMNCKRRVCFFAHSPDQLRVLSPRAESVSVSSPIESPPLSPLMANSVNDLVLSLRQLQLNKLKSMSSSWMGSGSPPRMFMARNGYLSLPTTPTRPAIGCVDPWDISVCEEEGPMMERVESGRNLRAKLFEKLSKENPLERVDPDPQPDPFPELGWVSELVK
ncbi:Zinc finger C-x8-C-x5-C-x3-H type family protein [Dorcoceras hygrometricum]|uniref:Zinc finger C-x8-C-x5-C-x3-H type family protein n=1 Tax=Dorcoceras hygrometricum TaxID=472368 RepID=A0A2Z7BDI8_9LAMI|nr:Zinc finger C-x8-C-x5-C-x3-H type family protein [Dorcoceras hygrometricum]